MFNYVVDRFLAAFYPPALETHQKTVFSYGDHLFEYAAVRVDDPSWYTILVVKKVKNCYQKSPKLWFWNISRKKTNRPAPRFTDGMLIAAMETAGKLVESEELAEILKEKASEHQPHAQKS